MSRGLNFKIPLTCMLKPAKRRTEVCTHVIGEDFPMGTFARCTDHSIYHRGAWTAQEDMILREYVKMHGSSGWGSVSQKSGLQRCAKSCRFRWLNYLRPGIKRGNISPAEEELITKLHGLLGNRWSLIAGRLPGRTGNEIKNYWNIHLSKRQPPKEAHRKPNRESKAASAVFKATTVKIRKGRSNGNSNFQNLQMSGAAQTANTTSSSKELLVDNLMREDHFKVIDFTMMENIAEKPFPSNLIDSSLPNFQRYAGKEVENLLDLNDLSSLLRSPRNSLGEIRNEGFGRRPTTGLEEMSCFESSIEVIKCLKANDNLEKKYDGKEQDHDWVDGLQYSEKASLEWLRRLLLELE